MTNYRNLNDELTAKCAELSCLIATGRTPAKKDYSKEWAAMRNNVYLKNKGRKF